VLNYVKTNSPSIFVKSGFMVGLGEKRDEVLDLLNRLAETGCDAVTIGQYLQPTAENITVKEYIEPEIFDFYKKEALKMGFRYIASGPFVRSSYMAHEGFNALKRVI